MKTLSKTLYLFCWWEKNCHVGDCIVDDKYKIFCKSSLSTNNKKQVFFLYDKKRSKKGHIKLQQSKSFPFWQSLWNHCLFLLKKKKKTRVVFKLWKIKRFLFHLHFITSLICTTEKERTKSEQRVNKEWTKSEQRVNKEPTANKKNSRLWHLFFYHSAVYHS